MAGETDSRGGGASPLKLSFSLLCSGMLWVHVLHLGPGVLVVSLPLTQSRELRRFRAFSTEEPFISLLSGPLLSLRQGWVSYAQTLGYVGFSSPLEGQTHTWRPRSEGCEKSWWEPGGGWLRREGGQHRGRHLCRGPGWASGLVT